MAFPASTKSLSVALDRSQAFAQGLKSRCASYRNRLANNSVEVSVLIGILSDLENAKAALYSFSQTPGLVDYAKQQLSDPGLDIAAEFSAVEASLSSSISWIIDNIPKDGSGHLLAKTISASGEVSDVLLSSESTSGLQSLLSGVEATIG